jgi:hypothetical protein
MDDEAEQFFIRIYTDEHITAPLYIYSSSNSLDQPHKRTVLIHRVALLLAHRSTAQH